MRSWIAFGATGLVLLTLFGPKQPTKSVEAQPAQDSPSSSLVKMAQAFTSQLDEAQKKKAVLSYGDGQRVTWQFIPLATRKGLPLMEMQADQQKAAMALLKTAISQLGYDKATKIMSLENVLRDLETKKAPATADAVAERRNPKKYYFTVYGTAGASEHWGLSIEGHHLSLNFVMQGDKIVDSTPQFFATNPAELKDNYGDGFEKGLRVLREEETLAFELLGSLKPDQRSAAMLPGATPGEIRGANEPQPPTTETVGVLAGSMDAKQKELFRRLLHTYTDKMRSEVSQGRWSLIEKAGFDKIAFGWSGADREGVGHYYRVQGPTFLIEFINVQADAAGNPANHIHCVWRDLEGDFDLPIK